MKIKEKDRVIIEKDKKIAELENRIKHTVAHKSKRLRPLDENEELAFALERIHQMENNNPFGIVENVPSSRMVNIMVPLENQVINQICPNPDAMSYEQLLELQEKIGYVDKGFKKDDVDKVPTVKFSKLRSSKYGNFADRCTVCQFEFEEGEILRKLSCGHLYHKGCVDDWLLKDKKCPVCKNEVKI